MTGSNAMPGHSQSLLPGLHQEGPLPRWSFLVRLITATDIFYTHKVHSCKSQQAASISAMQGMLWIGWQNTSSFPLFISFSQDFQASLGKTDTDQTNSSHITQWGYALLGLMIIKWNLAGAPAV